MLWLSHKDICSDSGLWWSLISIGNPIITPSRWVWLAYSSLVFENEKVFQAFDYSTACFASSLLIYRQSSSSDPKRTPRAPADANYSILICSIFLYGKYFSRKIHNENYWWCALVGKWEESKNSDRACSAVSASSCWVYLWRFVGRYESHVPFPTKVCLVGKSC